MTRCHGFVRYGHGGSIGWHRKSWPESARPAPCGCTPTFWNGPAVHSRPSAQAFESASGLAHAMRPGEHARIELCGRGVTVLHGHCWGSFSKDATPHPSLPSCGLWSVRVAALLHSPGWGGLDCALLIDMLDGEGGWMAGLWSWLFSRLRCVAGWVPSLGESWRYWQRRGARLQGAQLLSCRVTGELTPQVPSMALTPPRIEGVRA